MRDTLIRRLRALSATIGMEKRVYPSIGVTAAAGKALYLLNYQYHALIVEFEQLSIKKLNMKRNFNIVIERYIESNWLVVEVMELPGCYTKSPALPAPKYSIKKAIRAFL